jgi:hypothetical protein
MLWLALWLISAHIFKGPVSDHSNSAVYAHFNWSVLCTWSPLTVQCRVDLLCHLTLFIFAMCTDWHIYMNVAEVCVSIFTDLCWRVKKNLIRRASNVKPGHTWPMTWRGGYYVPLPILEPMWTRAASPYKLISYVGGHYLEATLPMPSLNHLCSTD